ncbi:MAG: TAXI family TRAP transporter solute-binding subunit [Rhodospirillaceae bacterium]|nr:TAXI family TRAP transporter solute-binding subunit [Rhodospirillales bacterium]
MGNRECCRSNDERTALPSRLSELPELGRYNASPAGLIGEASVFIRPLFLAVAMALGWSGIAAAEDLRFFQIGTGPTGEIRFPIGGLIANALSNPPGSRECERGGSCGVPGLVAVAKSTGGSVANVDAIQARRLDAALVHADIAFWANHGTGPYKNKAVPNLRGIAMLYPESLHLVARKDANIRTVRDLKGKRVSFGEVNSATATHGQIILSAYGLTERQIKLSPLKPAAAAEALTVNKLDAFLVVDGQPLPAITELARTLPITVIPIDGSEADRIRAQYPFLTAGTIAAETYDGIPEAVKTLDVGVALMAPAEVDQDLIYGVTRALWHSSTQTLLLRGNPRGKLIHLDSAALARMGIPLHAGASQFYADAGMKQ